MPPPYYEVGPENGLHVLKDVWKQKTHLNAQSLLLAENLDAAIRATENNVQIRPGNFQLDRPITEVAGDDSEERRLEAAMMARWNQPEMWQIPRGWNRLVAFQTPLFARQDRGQWGYIDLVGVNGNGVPVVVELKKSPGAELDGKTQSSETPLRMVLEAAAYAISLRLNWANFRAEWIARLSQLCVPEQMIAGVPEQLNLVPLVAAAPASFWVDWLPYTAKGQEVQEWRGFRSLLAGLQARSLPVAFVSISGHDRSPQRLAVQPLIGLPWS